MIASQGLIFPATTATTADTSSISTATSGALSFSQTTYNTQYVYFNGTLNASTQRTLLLKFNSSVTSGDYGVTALQEADNSGNTSLSTAGGLTIVFAGGPNSGSAASAVFNYSLILTKSSSNTAWILLGKYDTAAEGVGSIYGAGTFNANVTSIQLSSNSTFSATLNSIKAS